MASADPNQLGTLIKHQMEAKDHTPMTLADALLDIGCLVPRSTIYAWLAGTLAPRGKRLGALLHVLEIEGDMRDRVYQLVAEGR